MKQFAAIAIIIVIGACVAYFMMGDSDNPNPNEVENTPKQVASAPKDSDTTPTVKKETTEKTPVKVESTPKVAVKTETPKKVEVTETPKTDPGQPLVDTPKATLPDNTNKSKEMLKRELERLEKRMPLEVLKNIKMPEGKLAEHLEGDDYLQTRELVAEVNKTGKISAQVEMLVFSEDANQRLAGVVSLSKVQNERTRELLLQAFEEEPIMLIKKHIFDVLVARGDSQDFVESLSTNDNIWGQLAKLNLNK